MDTFLTLFDSENTISEDWRIKLKANLVLKTYRKGTLIKEKGEDTTEILFVKRGLLKSYTKNSKDKECVFLFAPKGWIVSDYFQSGFGDLSNLYIDTMEESEVYRLRKDFYDELLKHNPGFCKQQYVKLVRRTGILQKRIMMLLEKTAWERYQDFVDTYPELTQRVSQKLIASYLGVTPEALSKIRGDNTKRKNPNSENI